MNKEKKDEVFLVDGSGFIFRAYHALPPLTRPSDGTPVGAVLGFTNMLVKLLADYHAPRIAVIFDAARKNYRNDIYPAYKANRDETPEDLIPQFPLIREATKAFDIPALEMEGYEADDLIATYVRLAKEQNIDVTIVSSDKDLMQLVEDGVRMLDPMKNRFIGKEQVIDKFGVPPEKVIDVQSLAGDSIDNIPGVPGIGIKTAAGLINEYGDLDTLLERAGEIKQPKRREKLIENAEMARISRKLVSLDRNVPVTLPFSEMEAHNPSGDKLVEFLQEQGFRSVATRLGRNIAIPTASNHNNENSIEKFPSISENKYSLIQDVETLKKWIDKAYKTGILAIDTETTSLTPAKAKMVGISISSQLGQAAYIPLGHIGKEADLLGDASDNIKQIDITEAIRMLKPILEDASVLKIGQNIKYDWQILAKYDIEMTPMDDTMLLSYVLDGTSHSHSLDNLAKMYFNHQNIKYEDICGKGKSQITFDKVTLEKALDYAAEDAEITLRLWKILKPRLAKEKMTSVYENIERPLIDVIARMELTGVNINPIALKNMSEEFSKKLAILEEEIYKLAGQEFNIASPKQIGAILFDNMGIEGGKKTKSGDWSTDASTLEDLASKGYDIVEKILEWRQLSKLKSTYTDALLEQINPKTGRVHTSYSMAATATGRLSSSDPNLQNIPIRTEEGRKIRTAFIADTGHTILSVDYSQVELRLISIMANIPALKEAFKNGIDIHSATASSVFNIALEDITPELRRKAKAINFGIIYGISAFGLGKQLHISNKEAKEYIDSYFKKFPELKEFMEKAKEEAKKNGFVRTLYGRKCTISGINEKGPRKSFAERQAINAPVQGTAADIMKIAMAKVPQALKDAGLKAKQLMQVHDELVFEVPDNELEATKKIVKEVMENIFDGKSDVPLLAEAGYGKNWAEAH